MIKVRLLNPGRLHTRMHNAGEIIEVDASIAAILIREGEAEPVDKDNPPSGPGQAEDRSIRFRGA